MECEEFLEDYSDFLDGTLEDHPITDYRNHLEKCRSCADYDRVMRRGLHLVRTLDPPDAAADFLPRLHRRSFALQSRAVEVGVRRSNLAVAGLAAAALLAVISLPLLRPGARALRLPPVVIEGPEVTNEATSLWGPPPTFAPTASFLTVPDLSNDPFFSSPPRPYSLFRTPMRARTERAETGAETPQ